jgi:hypothetical protein
VRPFFSSFRSDFWQKNEQEGVQKEQDNPSLSSVQMTEKWGDRNLEAFFIGQNRDATIIPRRTAA